MQKHPEHLSQFKKKLLANKLKLTKNRQSIFVTLLDAESPLTVQEIIKSGSDEHHFVSIYRSIDALIKSGIVKQVPQGFKNKYELTDEFKPHHHHATCEICGDSKEVNSPELEKLMKQLTKQADLEPTKHHFEIYGICKNCQNTAMAATSNQNR